MTLFRAALICASLFMLPVAAPAATRAADVWGCDYDKCVAYCTKVSGKHCTNYCARRLQDKRRDKVCQ